MAKRFSAIESHYRFFAKTKEKKDEIIREAVVLSQKALHGLSAIVPDTSRYESLRSYHQQDVLKLMDLGPGSRHGSLT